MHVLVKTQSPCREFFHRTSTLGVSSSKFHLFLSYQESKAASSLNHESFTQLFKSCANFQLLKEGKSVHADAVKTGFDSYTSTNNSIMSFYFKVGMKDCAGKMFDEMPRKDSVSWNAVIHGFLSERNVQLGLRLFTEAMACRFVPNVSTVVLLLQAIWMLKDFSDGASLHGFIVKSGFPAYISVQNSLLNLYGKSKDVESAQKLFDQMPEKDIVTWSSLISGYAQNGCAVNALQLFRNLSMESGIEVDGIVLVSVLQACSFIRDLNHGKLVHSHVIFRGFEEDLFVSNSLIDVYAKCLDMNSAYMVFIQMPETNLVSWNAVLSGLLENEKPMEAFLMFETMKKEGIEDDAYTIVILMQACKKLGHEAFCRSIHSVIIRKLLECNNFVLNSLLDAYTKCGLIEHALKLFEKMSCRDVISWSTMISGFSHCGYPHKAITFFVQMGLAQEAPNSVTMLSLLEACSVLADLNLCKCVHSVAVKNELFADLSVETALLDAYSKCGSLDMSRKVFNGMNEKNVLSWNAMIGALAKNGCAREALASLDKMIAKNVKPNGVTILSLLFACSHGGLILEGLSLFQKMFEDHSLMPTMEHYSCIVDMLARAGHLNGGFEVIKRMSEEGVEASTAAWGALLGASRRFGDHEIGINVASRVLELEPSSSAGFVLSSNMYAEAGLRDEAAKFRLWMREKGVRVVSGYSLVHVGQHAKRFVSWDESDSRTEEIYSMTKLLHRFMRRHDENDLFLEIANYS